MLMEPKGQSAKRWTCLGTRHPTRQLYRFQHLTLAMLQDTTESLECWVQAVWCGQLWVCVWDQQDAAGRYGIKLQKDKDISPVISILNASYSSIFIIKPEFGVPPTFLSSSLLSLPPCCHCAVIVVLQITHSSISRIRQQ
jgi:hypothetical protein